MLGEALAPVNQTGKHLDASRLYRGMGELLLMQAGTKQKVEVEAEACFHQALAIAHGQQAKTMELRVAMSLARLGQEQRKHDAAREILSEIYGWFTEGFGTTTLQEARALLQALA